MPDSGIDPRIDSIQVQVSDGKPASVQEMADWMLRVLSGGNVDAYIADVMRRAAAGTTEASA